MRNGGNQKDAWALVEKSAQIYVFVAEKETLFVQPACIPRQLAVGTDNAVAWNQNGNGIAPHGTADRLGRHAALALLRRQSAGNFAIGRGFPLRNLPQ